MAGFPTTDGRPEIVKVRVVTDHHRWDVQDKEPPFVSSRWDNPVSVSRHNNLEHVWPVHGWDILFLDSQPALSNKLLQDLLTGLVSTPERFIRKQKQAI